MMTQKRHKSRYHLKPLRNLFHIFSTLKTEIAEKQREVQQRIKDKQEELEELKQAFDTLKVRETTAGANIGWTGNGDKHTLINLYSLMNSSEKKYVWPVDKLKIVSARNLTEKLPIKR